jgi:hypothetical protein
MGQFDNLSDSEIDKMVADKLALRINSNQSKLNFAHMSDDEIDKLVAEKMQGSQTSSNDRPVQAAIAGFGQGASFGYLPQLQAITEKGVDSLFSDNVDEKLKEQGFQLPEKPTYTETRDQYIKEGKSLQESNPKSYIGGGIAGSIASGISTGGAVSTLSKGAKATTMAGRFATAAKTGATVGAIRNPGDTEGELNPVQLEERAINAGKDALTGLVLQGGGEVIKKTAEAIKGSPKVIKAWSQIKSYKASGAMLKDFRKSFGNRKVSEIGQLMIDKKIVSLGDDVADIAKKADIAREDVGSTISKIYESADDTLSTIDPVKLTPEQSRALVSSEIDLGNFANAYKADLLKRFKGLSGSSTVVARISKELDDIAVNGKVTLKKLQEVRRSIDEQINFSKSTQELKGVQEELLGMRNKLQDIAKQRLLAVDKVTGGTSARELVKANKDYSNLAEVTKIANDRVARDSSNAAFGLRERISGGTGAVVGGMVGGIPGAAIGGVIGSMTTKVARNYGTPFVALAANRAAKALENNKELLGKFADPLIKAATSPKEFVAAIDLMMKDPEFKKKVQNINLNDFKASERGIANGKN